MSKKKYLEFKEDVPVSEKRKTPIIGVYSIQHGFKLGEIKWYGRWRQFAFFPVDETLYNVDCLIDISWQVHQLNEARKKRSF